MKESLLKVQLKENLGRFISISAEEFERVYAYVKIKKFKRREVIMDIGEVCKDAMYIGEGCLRYFHLVDGEEHTGQFFFENGWYTDYESFLTGEPSRVSIQAIEKCTLACFSRKDMYQIYEETPRFERFGRLMAETGFIGLRKKTETFAQLTPEERYLKLVKERPKVIQRIPQHFIASFLGIKPQSLSRIRKRLLENP